MKKLGISGLKLLKICHLICAIAWMGTAMGFLLELWVVTPKNPDQAYLYSLTMRLLDDWVLISGAYGILITGLIYGIWTNFGFFKFRWLTVKWILTIFMIMLGTFGMGPLVEANSLMSADIGFYQQLLVNLDQLRWYVLAQNILLLFVIYISVFKPWGRIKHS